MQEYTWPLHYNGIVCGQPRPVMPWKHRDLTTKEPRTRDSRFLHTGRRISRQLKLRTAAGALAQAKADWNKKYIYMGVFMSQSVIIVT